MTFLLTLGKRYHNMKKPSLRKKGGDGRVGGLPGSGLSNDNETLPKDLER
jgi:hypothetical protein